MINREGDEKKLRKYIIHRLIYVIPVLFGITFLTFALTYLSPGDPAELMLSATGNTPSQELIQQVREGLGLNKPFFVQYLNWLASVFSGDFGISYKYSKPVLDLILGALPATFKLAGLTMLMTVIVALPLGILSALYRNRLLDNVIRGISFLGISLPAPWIAIILMYIFALKFKLLPVMGSTNWTSIILPSASMTILMASRYVRQVRVYILEEISQDYVIGARARGVRDRSVLLRHVLRTTLSPIITQLGLSFGVLLGGAVIIETIFSWPGVGKLAIEAIFTRDYPLIQGYVVWMTIIYMLINMLVDISYYILDPRMRLEKGA
ncbi:MULTISPECIES: nickel ABC transporter permease [Clostridium]|uniref:Nickel import system permease protein NikB n=1 Tax=Clostridium cibarium TaxID=2762247 RepID=A0ABR8PSQ9_9CLOT|nr:MULTISPECIES: nickel ABC transporter permease [Clostridium]MBD7911210.1 ABC transporter permease [Clostridium cibarium]